MRGRPVTIYIQGSIMSENEVKTILNNPDLLTLPEYPDKITIGTEIMQVLALLEGWTGINKRLLRCDDLGGLCLSPMYGQFRRNTLITKLTVQNTWTFLTGIPSDCAAATIFNVSYPHEYRIYGTSGGDYYTLLGMPNASIDIPHPVGAISVNTFPNATGTVATMGAVFWQRLKK